MTAFVKPVRGASFCFVDGSWPDFRSHLAKSLDKRKKTLYNQLLKVMDGESVEEEKLYANQAKAFAAAIAVLSWHRRLASGKRGSAHKSLMKMIVRPTPSAWTTLSVDYAQASLVRDKKTGIIVVNKPAEKDGDCLLLDAYIDALSAVHFHNSSGGAFLFEGRQLINVGWQRGRKKFDVRALLREPYRLIRAPSVAR
ncbi:hypothetical protein [Alcanivorax sp. 1008]|uniref:hypothetical protein n=1 Tax=Alcanivorax sp. 1008 TaxID=2816853 RepID=UPI001D62C6F6|nr:hypothetical protein [Alcanivorax sp. 1008]MCC1496745.1 hypothetical protein [Alcanivorax sp. 1008]